MKLFFFFLVVVAILIQASAFSSNANSVANMDTDEASVNKKYQYHKKINCRYACSRRCRKASRKNVCHRACGTCCKRCHCVPPGTYGHKSACPCYAKLKTHANHLKCP